MTTMKTKSWILCSIEMILILMMMMMELDNS